MYWIGWVDADNAVSHGGQLSVYLNYPGEIREKGMRRGSTPISTKEEDRAERRENERGGVTARPQSQTEEGGGGGGA